MIVAYSFNFYIFSRRYGMYIKKINPYSLTYDDIDKKVIRVKVLIFNSESKILLCNVEGKYTFIGGHVEENETLTMALSRELREETGIFLNNQDFKSFIKIEKWNKNHFNTGRNCLSEIYKLDNVQSLYLFPLTVIDYINNINYKILNR